MSIIKAVLFLITLLVFSGCSSNVNSVKFDFEGHEFTLPTSVETFNRELDLKYYPYRGFKGKINGYTISIQIEGHPIWSGERNIPKEFYFEENVVGITFVDSEKKRNMKYEKFALEKKFNNKFQEKDGKYYFTRLDGLSCVLSEKKGKLYISFYCGISKKDLLFYASNIWE